MRFISFRIQFHSVSCHFMNHLPAPLDHGVLLRALVSCRRSNSYCPTGHPIAGHGGPCSATDCSSASRCAEFSWQGIVMSREIHNWHHFHAETPHGHIQQLFFIFWNTGTRIQEPGKQKWQPKSPQFLRNASARPPTGSKNDVFAYRIDCLTLFGVFGNLYSFHQEFWTFGGI